MKPYLSERNLVVLLFVLVLVSFSLAYEDSKKAERIYTGTAAAAIGRQLTADVLTDAQVPAKRPTE